jgi:hypothetical protein
MSLHEHKLHTDFFYLGPLPQDRQTNRSSRKHRTTFTDSQLYQLELEFANTKYLSLAERQRIAQMLDMTDVQVKTWFQNRRMKFKRQHSERQVTPTLWKNDNFYRRLNSSSAPEQRMYRTYNMPSPYIYSSSMIPAGARRLSYVRPSYYRSLPHQQSSLMTPSFKYRTNTSFK